MSNNSVAYLERPDELVFMEEWLALTKSRSGERGIFNREAARYVRKKKTVCLLYKRLSIKQAVHLGGPVQLAVLTGAIDRLAIAVLLDIGIVGTVFAQPMLEYVCDATERFPVTEHAFHHAVEAFAVLLQGCVATVVGFAPLAVLQLDFAFW